MDADSPRFAETIVQLVLRGRRTDALVQTDGDWRELGLIAARMLFWCGGAIYGCRCECSDIRFALQVARASLGAMAQHISGAYALHLRRAHGLREGIFKHYTAMPLHDETLLVELVLWMHRADSGARVWTADDAYLTPNSLPWIDTTRVFGALGGTARGPAAYRRRKSEEISPQVVAHFTRRPQRLRLHRPVDPTLGLPAGDQDRPMARPGIEAIARLVADAYNVSYEDMLADTRKRAVSKARVIATVLATRNGATAAAAARLFRRSRSTLIEQVDYYRATQPEIFAEAELILEEFLAEVRR
jgi:hypothetical protein